MFETYILRLIIHFSGCHISDNLSILKHICELKNDSQEGFKPFCLTFTFFLFLTWEAPSHPLRPRNHCCIPTYHTNVANLLLPAKPEPTHWRDC